MSEYKLFTLLEKNNTGELHLFHSRYEGNTCKVKQESICKKMNFTEKSKVIFSCLDENEARKRCADEGRKVCGTCVSNLYADY